MDMDADLTWEQLQKQTQDKDKWRDRVNILKITSRRVTTPVQTLTIKTIVALTTNVKFRGSPSCLRNQHQIEKERKIKTTPKQEKSYAPVKNLKNAELYDKRIHFFESHNNN